MELNVPAKLQKLCRIPVIIVSLQALILEHAATKNQERSAFLAGFF